MSKRLWSGWKWYWRVKVKKMLSSFLCNSVIREWLLMNIQTKKMDTLKAFDNFKANSKSIWSNVFWSAKVCILWRCIQYTIHWDKTQKLKKFPSEKINGTIDALSLFLRAPTHYSFTFNFQFLYELKHRVRLSKIACGFSSFDSVSFLSKFLFFSTKCLVSLTLKGHN